MRAATEPAEAELHQMATLGRLSASLAHEINSPIGSVLSNNEVLRRSLERLSELLQHPEPTSLKQAARVIETCRSLAEVDRMACERIRGLIRGIKSFGRADDGAPAAMDLNQELRETACLAMCQFNRRIDVTVELGELPEVVGYRQMLSQVFLNLFINAAQAIEGQGTITVRSAREGDAVHVSIADTGKGMTAEQKARVFQTGFTTKARGEGTGLGLAISREIVEEKHGGRMDFESEAGVGTTFHVRLPIGR